MKVKKAVIPAAGFGTRLLPYTKAQPKEMVCIYNKPSIQHVVEEAVNAGIEDILIIISRNKNSIEDHFDSVPELEKALKDKGKDDYLKEVQEISNLGNMHFIRQKEAKGLGHAIGMAEAFVGDEPFAILLPDDIMYSEVPVIGQLMKAYDEHGKSVLGVQPVEREAIRKYGIAGGKSLSDKDISVEVMVEKPEPEEAPSNLGILGRYVLTPSVFKYIKETKPGKGGEIQLTDAIEQQIHNEGVIAHSFDGIRYDIGNRLGYMIANLDYALRDEEVKGDLVEYIRTLNL
jgi:UTP--glucose-1-phosphate uridylyltransferase